MSDDRPAAVNMDLLKRRIAELEKASDTRPLIEERYSGGGGSGPHMPDMSERLGRIEGEISGLKHSQNIHLAALAGSFATVLVAVGIVFAILLSLWNKVDQQGDQIVQLPGKISAELRDITRTLAESITAAKQTPPQIILMPAPQLPPTQPTPQRQP